MPIRNCKYPQSKINLCYQCNVCDRSVGKVVLIKDHRLKPTTTTSTSFVVKKSQKLHTAPSETENILTLLLLLPVAGCAAGASCKSQEMQEEEREGEGVAQTHTMLVMKTHTPLSYSTKKYIRYKTQFICIGRPVPSVHLQN